MKKLIFFLLLLSTSVLPAQIEYSIDKQDANCRGSNNGKIEVTLVPLQPPYTYSWSNGSGDSVLSGLAPGDYSCTITDSAGNDTSFVVTINEIPCPLKAELIFTPNGDGYNDTWTINGTAHYPELKVQVFNRWGQKVFERKGAYEPWDGKDNAGRDLPDNSYYYILLGDDKDEATLVKGSVTILR